MQHRIQLLWFGACPHHESARALIHELVESVPGTVLEDVDASDPAVADRYRFPGSPTVRVDGHDVEPGFRDPGDYTPRCRLYRTARGLVGLPDPEWIEQALGVEPLIP